MHLGQSCGRMGAEGSRGHEWRKWQGGGQIWGPHALRNLDLPIHYSPSRSLSNPPSKSHMGTSDVPGALLGILLFNL